MNFKRILLITIALMIIASSLSLISAADKSDVAIDVHAKFDADKKPCINIELTPQASADCSGKTIYVNVTDSDGNTKEYNLTTTKTSGNIAEANITNITSGKYQVSVYMPESSDLKSNSTSMSVTFYTENGTSDGELDERTKRNIDTAVRMMND